MLQVIDPSVADETDPFSTVPELDMYNPDNGWRPWPEPCHYDPEWLARYREAQVQSVARIDAVAKAALADNTDAGKRLRAVDKDADLHGYREFRRRAVFSRYLTIYRTLADPAYLDLSVDPEETENRAGEKSVGEMIELLRTALTAIDAPSEQLVRLGID